MLGLPARAIRGDSTQTNAGVGFGLSRFPSLLPNLGLSWLGAAESTTDDSGFIKIGCCVFPLTGKVAELTHAYPCPTTQCLLFVAHLLQ